MNTEQEQVFTTDNYVMYLQVSGLHAFRGSVCGGWHSTAVSRRSGVGYGQDNHVGTTSLPLSLPCRTYFSWFMTAIR